MISAHFYLLVELNSAEKIPDIIEKLADVHFLQLHRQDSGNNYIVCCSFICWLIYIICFVVVLKFKTKILANLPFVHKDLRQNLVETKVLRVSPQLTLPG